MSLGSDFTRLCEEIAWEEISEKKKNSIFLIIKGEYLITCLDGESDFRA